jgi:hypothetical protein
MLKGRNSKLVRNKDLTQEWNSVSRVRKVIRKNTEKLIDDPTTKAV